MCLFVQGLVLGMPWAENQYVACALICMHSTRVPFCEGIGRINSSQERGRAKGQTARGAHQETGTCINAFMERNSISFCLLSMK